MNIRVIPYYKDNFCYLFRALSSQSQKYTIVDPGDSKTIFGHIVNNKWIIDRILLTHKHWDHIGDFEQFYENLNTFYTQDLGLDNHKVKVFAGSKEELTFPHTKLCVNSEEENLDFGDFTVRCKWAPCHTKGHILYYVQAKNGTDEESDFTTENPDHFVTNSFLLTGDTLFAGGIGRFFEGDATQMVPNMEFIKSLPEDTPCFYGHDYAISNLNWALKVDWEHPGYENFKSICLARQAKGFHLQGFTIGQEKDGNIFLRYDTSNIQGKLKVGGADSNIKTMQILRDMKNEGIGFR